MLRKSPAVRIDESVTEGNGRDHGGTRGPDRVPDALLPGVPDQDRKALACWSGQRGLNSRPRPWQGRVLPAELCPQTTTLTESARVTSPAKPLA